MNVQQGPQVSDLVGIVRRRGKMMAIVAGVTILLVYWLAMALPNQYRSYAVILVEPQTVDDTLIRAGIRESDLKERLGIMTSEILSRSRLSRLIDTLDLYPVQSQYMLRQEVIDLMRAHVIVEPVLSELEADQRNRRELEFNTFKITFLDESAEVAALVAQSIANDFLDANIKDRVEVSQQSLDFMQDSIRSLSIRIVDVEAAIKKVKEENFGHLPEDLATNQRLLQVILGQLRDASRSLDLARSDEAFWKNQVIAAVSMSAPNDSASPAYRMKILQTELGMMLSRGYTQKHPDVLQVRHELQLLRGRMEAGAESDEEPMSFTVQNAKSEQRRAALRAQSGIAEIKRLSAQLVDTQGRIAATPAAAEQLDALARQYDQLSTSFQEFAAKRQQAAVQANLERKQLGEQFRILEPAFPATRPRSPNRVMILILGMMFGIGMGVALGLVVESIDSSVHQSRDLQAATNVPVLASIPAILLEPDRAARTRKIFREAIIAAVFVVFCLSGGAVTYFYVNGFPSIFSSSSGGDDDEETSQAESAEQALLDLDTEVRG